MQYVAGKCNIGRKNRAKRIVTGAAFLVSAFFIYYLITGNQLDKTFLMMLFPIFSLGFLTIIEAAKGFCVFYALNGTYNFDSNEVEVVSAADRAKDKMKAFEILLIAVAAAAVATGIIYFI